VDAHTLLANFRARGITLTPHGARLMVKPASRLSAADLEAIRSSKRDLLHLLSNETAPPSDAYERHSISAAVVELVFVDPREELKPLSPDFPPCRVCRTSNYWISSLGKVLCSVCGPPGRQRTDW
jgi:hypothetical protein